MRRCREWRAGAPHLIPVAALALLFTAPPPAGLADPPAGYPTMAVFSDEFDGTAIDAAKWDLSLMNYPSGNTWLHRNYPGNNAQAGGYLRQTTLYQDIDADGVKEWTCSSMRASVFRQRFGYWEAHMQITRYGYTDANWWSTDPGGVHLNDMDGFEIDAPEAWAPSHYTSHIYDHNTSRAIAYDQTILGIDLSRTFNTYGWEWATDNSVRLYFNGTLLHAYTPQEMNSIEALIPQSPVLGTALWITGSNSTADGDVKLVDYVRVYQKPGWTGGANETWNNAANWGPDGVPGSGLAAVFNTSAPHRAIALGVDQPVQELIFQTGAIGAASINGPGKLLLGAATAVNAENQAAGGITINNDAVGTVTINADIVAQRKLQFSNFSGTGNFGGTPGVQLVLNGSLGAATTGTDINFLTTGPIQVNGTIDSAIGTLTKGGQGTVFLNAANTFLGGIDHRDGQIVVNADGALGSTAGGVAFTATSAYGSPALVFGNVDYLAPVPLSIQGTGNQGSGYPSVLGAIDVAGTNTAAGFPGPITLTSDATIASGRATQNASLTLSGSIAVGANTLTLNSGGTLNLTGQITGTGVNGEGRIIKTGVGPAIITGNNLPFKGTWTFRAGTVVVSGVGALGGGTGQVLNFDGGRLELSGSLTTAKGGSFSASGGTIDTNGHAASLGGGFSGSGGLTKEGSGVLTLSAASGYSGMTTIREGTLKLSATASSNILSLSSAILIGNGATLDVSGLNNGSNGKLSLAVGQAVTGTGATGTIISTGYGGLQLNGNNSLSNTAGGTLSVRRLDVFGLNNQISAGSITSGGTATARGLVLGNAGTGVLSLTGGTLTSLGGAAYPDLLGNGTSGSGTLAIDGGSYVNTAGAGSLRMSNGGGASGNLTVTAGAATINVLSMSATGSATDTLGLNGGTLTLARFDAAGDGARFINLNGGILAASANLTVSGLGQHNVRAGGAMIDTNGQIVSYTDSLLHSTLSADSGLAVDGGLTKLGAGTLILSGSNTFNGGLNVMGGTLVLSAGCAVADGTMVNVAANASLLFDALAAAPVPSPRESPATAPLSPVPEPDALALLTVAAACGVRGKRLMRRRR